MCYCPTPTLHLNLALTGDCAFLFSLKKTHSVWFISVLNYGDTENVLIKHLLLVIPMLYPCHYTNLCPHKPHKHAHTHTHTCVQKALGHRLHASTKLNPLSFLFKPMKPVYYVNGCFDEYTCKRDLFSNCSSPQTRADSQLFHRNGSNAHPPRCIGSNA